MNTPRSSENNDDQMRIRKENQKLVGLLRHLQENLKELTEMTGGDPSLLNDEVRSELVNVFRELVRKFYLSTDEEVDQLIASLQAEGARHQRNSTHEP